MASVNKCIFIGNVGQDPEVKYLESGMAVAKLSLAVSESYKNKNGEQIQTTEWVRLEFWDKMAQIVEKYVRKGGQIYVEGKMQSEKWTNKEGVEMTSIKIRVQSLTLLGGTGNPKLPENGITNDPPAQKPVAQQPSTQNFPPVTTVDDDDLPF